MLQIDYCCGGDKPLENVCWENGLEVLRVHSLLKQTVADTNDTEHPDWINASLTELCDHIEQKHHARLKDSLPLLSSLMAEVVDLHGKAHEELREVQQHFMTWRDEILTAMAEEERSLFPAIRQYDSDADHSEAFTDHSEALTDHSEALTDHSEAFTASLRKMIHWVRFEHADIGEALKKTRSASKNFLAPKDACAKFSQMYQLLRWIEADVRQYVHKEESILFPRVKKRLQS